MYVCMYVCIFTCTYMHAYIQAHTHTRRYADSLSSCPSLPPSLCLSCRFLSQPPSAGLLQNSGESRESFTPELVIEAQAEAML